MGIETNYYAVIIAALIYFGSGALWYSPLLFGQRWMTLVGLSDEKMRETKKDAWKSYLIALVAALVISFGLARIEAYMNVITISGGLQTGFWAWFCFVISTMATNNSFAGRPPLLLFIDGFYHLYGFLVMGIVLAVWK